ncbi:MAG TPA: hypothetical protein PKA66_11690 [Gemmatimonadales bacterium]|nr:hypothetical protein [Gemmatimonadales bacterium]
MIRRIELVFFEGCPHANEARLRLRQVLAESGLEAAWQEWDTSDGGTPLAYRGFGSPTILIDGRAVGGGIVGSGMGCAVGGAPSEEAIHEALRVAPQ